MHPRLVDPIVLRPNVDVDRLANRRPEIFRKWRKEHSNVAAAGAFDDVQILKAILFEYYRSIENVDANVGRLIDAIRRRNLWENTVFVFFSDHGELLGSHGAQGKQLPFRESAGIPLIVGGAALRHESETGAESSGNVIRTPVSIEDLYPTTLDLAGVPIPSGKPGLSLVPLLLHETHAVSAAPPSLKRFDRDAVFLEYVEEHRDSHKSIPPWRAIRTERYSYAITSTGPWMLFDVFDDPYELTNRVVDPVQAPVRGELHARLVAHLRELADPFLRTYGASVHRVRRVH